jgi:two-component system, cell cycle response regulator DivK
VLVELTTFVLAAAGFTVESVTDPTDALSKVTAFRPDLILMDVQMPGIDGLELTRRLKADLATQHIVVIAFTAFAMKGDEARMRRAGCEGYVAKPFDVDSLAATLHSHLPKFQCDANGSGTWRPAQPRG